VVLWFEEDAMVLMLMLCLLPFILLDAQHLFLSDLVSNFRVLIDYVTRDMTLSHRLEQNEARALTTPPGIALRAPLQVNLLVPFPVCLRRDNQNNS
jgi:hypothetical protein